MSCVISLGNTKQKKIPDGQTRKILDSAAPIQGPINEPLLDKASILSCIGEMYLVALQKINSKYPEGCYEWLKQNMPELYQEICGDDDWLNEVWHLCIARKSVIQDFQTALDIWQESWMEAIKIFEGAKN